MADTPESLKALWLRGDLTTAEYGVRMAALDQGIGTGIEPPSTSPTIGDPGTYQQGIPSVPPLNTINPLMDPVGTSLRMGAEALSPPTPAEMREGMPTTYRRSTTGEQLSYKANQLLGLIEGAAQGMMGGFESTMGSLYDVATKAVPGASTPPEMDEAVKRRMALASLPGPAQAVGVRTSFDPLTQPMSIQGQPVKTIEGLTEEAYKRSKREIKRGQELPIHEAGGRDYGSAARGVNVIAKGLSQAPATMREPIPATPDAPLGGSAETAGYEGGAGGGRGLLPAIGADTAAIWSDPLAALEGRPVTTPLELLPAGKAALAGLKAAAGAAKAAKVAKVSAKAAEVLKNVFPEVVRDKAARGYAAVKRTLDDPTYSVSPTETQLAHDLLRTAPQKEAGAALATEEAAALVGREGVQFEVPTRPPEPDPSLAGIPPTPAPLPPRQGGLFGPPIPPQKPEFAARPGQKIPYGRHEPSDIKQTGGPHPPFGGKYTKVGAGPENRIPGPGYERKGPKKPLVLPAQQRKFGLPKKQPSGKAPVGVTPAKKTAAGTPPEVMSGPPASTARPAPVGTPPPTKLGRAQGKVSSKRVQRHEFRGDLPGEKDPLTVKVTIKRKVPGKTSFESALTGTQSAVPGVAIVKLKGGYTLIHEGTAIHWPDKGGGVRLYATAEDANDAAKYAWTKTSYDFAPPSENAWWQDEILKARAAGLPDPVRQTNRIDWESKGITTDPGHIATNKRGRWISALNEPPDKRTVTGPRQASPEARPTTVDAKQLPPIGAIKPTKPPIRVVGSPKKSPELLGAAGAARFTVPKTKPQPKNGLRRPGRSPVVQPPRPEPPRPPKGPFIEKPALQPRKPSDEFEGVRIVSSKKVQTWNPARGRFEDDVHVTAPAPSKWEPGRPAKQGVERGEQIDLVDVRRSTEVSDQPTHTVTVGLPSEKSIEPLVSQLRKLMPGDKDVVQRARVAAAVAMHENLGGLVASPKLRRKAANVIVKQNPELKRGQVVAVLERMAQEESSLTLRVGGKDIDVQKVLTEVAASHPAFLRKAQEQALAAKARQISMDVRRAYVNKQVDAQLKLNNKPDEHGVDPVIWTVDPSRAGLSRKGYRAASDETLRYLGKERDYVGRATKPRKGEAEPARLYMPAWLDRQIHWQQKVDDTFDSASWWIRLGRYMKSNLITQRLSTQRNNLLPGNMMYQTITNADPLIPARYVGALVERLRMKHGLLDDADKARMWRAYDRTGAPQSTAVYSEVGAYDRAGLLDYGTMAGLKDALPTRAALAWRRGLERAYGWGDDGPRSANYAGNWKQGHRMLNAMEDGTELRLEVHNNRWTTLTKKGDKWVVDGKVYKADELDDVIAKAAVHPSRGDLFDYSDRALLNKQAAYMAAKVGPFSLVSFVFTWMHKALDIPGVKRGLFAKMFTPGMRVRSTSPAINRMIRNDAALRMMRMQALIGAAKGEAGKEEHLAEFRAAFDWPGDAGFKTIEMLAWPGWASVSSWEGGNMLQPTLLFAHLLQRGRVAWGELVGDEDYSFDKLYPMTRWDGSGKSAKRVLSLELPDDMPEDQKKMVLVRRRLMMMSKASRPGETLKLMGDMVGLGGGPLGRTWSRLFDRKPEDTAREFTTMIFGGQIPGAIANEVFGIAMSSKDRALQAEWARSTDQAGMDWVRAQQMTRAFWAGNWRLEPFLESVIKEDATPDQLKGAIGRAKKSGKWVVATGRFKAWMIAQKANLSKSAVGALKADAAYHRDVLDDPETADAMLSKAELLKQAIEAETDRVMDEAIKLFEAVNERKRGK